MKEQMKQLEALQEIDTRISRLEKDKAFFPAEVVRLEEVLRAEGQSLTDAKEKLAASEKEKRDMDDELSVNTERMTLFKGRLRSLKTNAEYQASLKEIDQANKRNTEIEDQLLALMERIEEETKALSEAKAAHAAKEAEFEKEKKALLENGEKAELNLQEVIRERKAMLQTLKPEVSKLYESLNAKLKGVVMATAVNGTCTGCHLHLPPQLLNDVMRFEKIYQCPNCYRILAVNAD